MKGGGDSGGDNLQLLAAGGKNVAVGQKYRSLEKSSKSRKKEKKGRTNEETKKRRIHKTTITNKKK